MAVNSLNSSLKSCKYDNISKRSQQKQLIFSSKNNCFKKSWNLCSNALNENNNNNYFNYNNNNNDNKIIGLKSDFNSLIDCEEKLNSNKLKSNTITNSVNSVENIVENLETTSNEEIDGQFMSEGMKDVPKWLKVLRLHKYSNLFSNVSYEELLNTTEEELEKKNVTKGARHKLIISINQLRNRPKIIKTLEKNLISQRLPSVRQTLIEIKSLLTTPFKPSNSVSNGSQLKHHFNNTYRLNSIQNNSDSNLLLFIANDSNGFIGQQLTDNLVNNCDINSCVNLSDEDLPEMFTRLLGIVYAIFIETSNTDEESFNLFNSALDRCLAHDSFSLSQKSRLNFWKQNINKIWTSRALYRRSVEGRLKRSKWSHTSVCNTLSNNNSNRVEMNGCNSSSHSTAGSVVIRKHFSSITSNNSLSISQKSVPVINQQLLNIGFEPHFGNVLSQNSQNQMRSRAQLYRTHSAPVGRSHSQTENHFHSSTYECDQQLDDIEKLCIRMTEQALGISDGGLLENIDHDLL